MKFLVEMIERAVKTAAQAALTTIGGNLVSAWDMNLHAILGMSGGAAVISVLTSLASITVGPKGTPSLVPTVTPEG